MFRLCVFVYVCVCVQHRGSLGRDLHCGGGQTVALVGLFCLAF